MSAEVFSLMSAESRAAAMPLAISRAVVIEAVMPPIAVQSILSAPSGDGCVGASIVVQGGADTPFVAPHACGHAAGLELPQLVRRAREGARRFAWLRGRASFLPEVRHLVGSLF